MCDLLHRVIAAALADLLRLLLVQPAKGNLHPHVGVQVARPFLCVGNRPSSAMQRLQPLAPIAAPPSKAPESALEAVRK